ncbi:transmembrane protein 64-like isoform X1 [Stegostoma tigrinum]|uniref:transmembrane protein 64-like isoform X1 n=1 Tax=Stegostoma tigrinum TaxID=3053191 RepID=UPI002870059D|nr:transmembrane protein 64-like isoform X1 [Stegostoma tigrinum]
MPSGVTGAVPPGEPLSVSRFRACAARCCLLAVAVGTALGGVAFWSCRRLLLRWLEGQQFRAGLLLFSLAFILISFPWTWGYTLLSLAPGYLYGFQRGLAVLVFGVAVGTLAAHLVTQRWLLAPMGALVRGNAKLSAIIRVLDGTNGLKVVFLARLTPIPFGLQNAVFAWVTDSATLKVHHVKLYEECLLVVTPDWLSFLSWSLCFTGFQMSDGNDTQISKLETLHYLATSTMGLLPSQILNSYLGSTVRTMEDVVNHRSPEGYLAFILQIFFSVAMMLYLVRRAHQELNKTIQAHDAKQPGNEAVPDNDKETHSTKRTNIPLDMDFV